MKLYQGIIEDVNDPLKLGRVRVRVFGLHTDDTNLIPVNTLPWAICMQSTTSASMSGLGFSATGLLQGSWVVLFFQDADNQYPVVIGSLHGTPVDTTSQVTADEETRFEYSDNEATVEENVLKDGSGNTVTTGDGEPVKVDPPQEPAAPTGKVDPSKLGSVSARYESNGNPATINKYANGADLGGASYGAYQFASYLRGANTPTRSSVTQQQIKTSPINTFIRRSGLTQFNGLSPATPEFDAAWKQWANADKAASLAVQHKYIEQNYYQVSVAKLPQSITQRGLAVHEMIWSMSVQMGPGGAANKIRAIVGNVDPSVCDHIVVDKVYSSRVDTVQSDFRSSPNLWPGLIKRFNSEKAQLIAMAKGYQTGECAGEVITKEEPKVEYKDTEKKVVTEKVTAPATPSARSLKKGKRGFVDPSGQYPLYYNEQDTNRLARGILTGTIVERKRAEVVSGKEAGDGIITEPTTQYNTKYPHNKVFATSSGHIFEIDDTPGYERIHVYHKSGTFVEMYPDGSMVTKVKGGNTLVVNNDDNTIVLGSRNLSVDGDSNTTISGNLRLVVNGNVDTTVYGDVTMDVTGNTKITSARIDLN